MKFTAILLLAAFHKVIHAIEAQGPTPWALHEGRAVDRAVISCPARIPGPRTGALIEGVVQDQSVIVIPVVRTHQ